MITLPGVALISAATGFAGVTLALLSTGLVTRIAAGSELTVSASESVLGTSALLRVFSAATGFAGSGLVSTLAGGENAANAFEPETAANGFGAEGSPNEKVAAAVGDVLTPRSHLAYS